jgi:hypothetical protein
VLECCTKTNLHDNNLCPLTACYFPKEQPVQTICERPLPMQNVSFVFPSAHQLQQDIPNADFRKNKPAVLRCPMKETNCVVSTYTSTNFSHGMVLVL